MSLVTALTIRLSSPWSGLPESHKNVGLRSPCASPPWVTPIVEICGLRTVRAADRKGGGPRYRMPDQSFVFIDANVFIYELTAQSAAPLRV
jgi:hypothetical protein